MNSTTQLPAPETVLRQIAALQEELAALRRLLRAAQAAQKAEKARRRRQQARQEGSRADQ